MANSFRPPIPNRLLYRFFVAINRPLLSRGISWNVDEESLANWRMIPKGSAYFIASKHAHYNDHFLIAGIAAENLRTQCLFVSIPEAFEQFLGLAGMVVRRLGGFPVERGGTNIQATHYIIEALLKAEYPLLIFPEGELYFLNDVVTPLKVGTALFALEGAKARQSAGKGKSTYILPVGIKYVYRGNAVPVLLKKLMFCEEKFYKSKRTGDLLARVRRLLEDVEQGAEIRLGLQLTGGTPEARFFSMSQEIVESLEQEAHGKIFPGDAADRARRLMAHLPKGSPGSKKALFAIHCLDFLPGYLQNPTTERIMETLRKLERLITGNENPSFPGNRELLFGTEAPIKVHDYLQDYTNRSTARQVLAKLTADLQGSLQRSIDALCRRAEAVETVKIPAGISV